MTETAVAVKVRLVLADKSVKELDDVTAADVDRWLATKVVVYKDGDARMIHPMSALLSIIVFDE